MCLGMYMCTCIPVSHSLSLTVCIQRENVFDRNCLCHVLYLSSVYQHVHMCVFPYLSSVSYSMCVCSSFIHLCLAERAKDCLYMVCLLLSISSVSQFVCFPVSSLTINAYMSLYVCGKGVNNKKLEIETHRCHLSCKTNNSLPHYIYSRFPVCHQTFIN